MYFLVPTTNTVTKQKQNKTTKVVYKTSLSVSPNHQSPMSQAVSTKSHLLITRFINPCSRECIQSSDEFIECITCKCSICIDCYLLLLKRLKITMKEYHYSQKIYYNCHKCQSISPTLAFRSLNQQRKQYIIGQAFDPINWIFDVMRFIELNEAENYVLIKGIKITNSVSN